MATTITIQTGCSPVKLSAHEQASEAGVTSVYEIPAETQHTTSIPDGWVLTVSDVDAE